MSSHWLWGWMTLPILALATAQVAQAQATPHAPTGAPAPATQYPVNDVINFHLSFKDQIGDYLGPQGAEGNKHDLAFAQAKGPLNDAARSAAADRLANGFYPSLLATAATARFRLSASNERFLAGFDPLSRATIERALSSKTVDRRTWPQVMAGALQIRHQSGAEGETLWFNPLFDAGLAVQWHRIATNWTVTKAWSVLGESLRADSLRHGASLLAGDVDRSVVSDQFNIAARELPRFAAPNWHAPMQSSDATTEIVSRVRAADAAIAVLRQSPGYARAVVDAYELLAFSGPDTSGIRPALKRAIAGVDPDSRLTLRPVTAFRNGADWTLIMQSPDIPGAAWFVNFDRIGNGPARVASASMSSYAQAEAVR